jgi:hypothetical protein
MDNTMRFGEGRKWLCDNGCSSLIILFLCTRAGGKIDIILATDVVYDRQLFECLLHALNGLADNCTKIILSFVKRWKSSSAFFKKLRKMFDVWPIECNIYICKDVLSFSAAYLSC